MAKQVVVLDLTSGRLKQSATFFLETDDAVVIPIPSGIVRAKYDGKIDAGWIPQLSIGLLPVAADGEVSSTKVLRADDTRLGNPTVGGDLSGTANAATVIKIRGRSVADITPADKQLMGWNEVLARWEPVNPSAAGGGVSIAEIDDVTTVSGVSFIRVPNGSLSDDGGGTVTLNLSGAGGESPGGILFLYYSTY
jgi:hypothetical protein